MNMLYSKKILIALTILPVFTQSAENKCYTLISYGYKNSAEKAKREWKNLTPEKKQEFIGCDTYTKASLYSSIFHRKIFVQDLRNIYKTNIGNGDFIILGHSRGSEMALHYTGKYNPQNLKALVLFASPISVAEAIKSKIFGMPNKISGKIAQSIVKIKNKSLPIILFHQINDKLVSYQHSEMLAQFLRNNGFKEVYLVKLTTGAHKDLIDTFGYTVLQSFYKHYKLSHDPKYATLKESELLQYKVK